MRSWTRHRGWQGLQGMALHRRPRELEDAPEPQLREEVGKAFWRRRPLSLAQGKSRERQATEGAAGDPEYSRRRR